MNLFRKFDLEEEFTKAVFSTKEIDLLFNSEDDYPFLYRKRKIFISSIFIASILIPVLITLAFFCEHDAIYSLAAFTLSQAVIFICGFFLFSYFESYPIRKRMKSLNISPSSCFDFRTSKELSQMVLERIYQTCIQKKLLHNNHGDCQIIDYFISIFTTSNSSISRGYKLTFLTAPIISGILSAVVGAFLGASWAYAFSTGQSIDAPWEITKLILLIYLTIFFLLENLKFSIHTLMESRRAKTKKIHRTLLLLKLNISNSKTHETKKANTKTEKKKGSPKEKNTLKDKTT